MSSDPTALFSSIPYQIDRDSPIPLYHQISEAILEIIKMARLQPNTKIPSEEHLCQILDVSKMTVRQALAKLVRDGVLERRQGSGTFVAEKKIERRATKLVSFFDDIREKGLVPTSTVIEKVFIPPNRQVMKRLRLRKNERVLRITRVRFANELPLAVNYGHVPERLCPDIPEEELASISLSQLLEQRYRIVVEYAVQHLQAVRAMAYEASLLKIDEGDPLLHMERIMFDRNDVPVSYYVSLFRGDKYVFTSTLYR
jgi:GntR family transcriptional regulator